MSLETITAPLPGKILKISANPGDKIAEGGELCIIESMKMENPILASVSGTIKEISVSSDQIVKIGEAIAVIEF